MIQEIAALILPAFFAGLLTFLAPCTLPLVPGYLGFISGVSAKELKEGKSNHAAHKKVLVNGLMYVIGFSIVFILLGTLFAAAGAALAEYRILLSRIGGGFIILFALYLLHVFDLKIFAFLNRERRWHVATHITPGKPLSSFVFGVTFALGWTPCVGPVLGSILLLAGTSGTALAGAFLLTVFSFGLALPFMLLAIVYGHAQEYIAKIHPILHGISIAGGILLLAIGVLLVTDSFVLWNSLFYDLFGAFGGDALLQYL